MSDLTEGKEFVTAIIVGNAYRHAIGIGGMSVDAFMGNVQPLAIAVKQCPQRFIRKLRYVGGHVGCDWAFGDLPSRQ